MFEGFGLVVLLLPIGFALGWTVARRHIQQGAPGAAVDKPSDYLAGLDAAGTDDADASMTTLIQAVEVTDQTADLHLTLGSLFRRRGEVDRALRLHQNVLAQEGLAAEFAHRARLELAHDYQKAGLLDHAEKLFGALVDEGLFQAECLTALVGIYEQEHDWDKAIVAAQRLQAVRGESLRPVIAHYHCELADLAKADGDFRQAERLAEQALSESRGSVRASLVLGGAREALDDQAGAIAAYQRVPDQDLRFFREVMPGIERAYRKADDLRGLRGYLKEAEKDYPTALPSVMLAKLMRESGEDAAQFLADRMSRQPSWSGLHALLQEVEGLGEPVRVLRSAIENSMKAAPSYRCRSCGLTPRFLFWQCPSCKQWDSIEPLPDDIQSIPGTS
ncbi:MAG: tetratricopeptide repeat protein [Pseudomonadota bacterium]|nr:tetratricopeptide repeat protein [Pseudomonadota bacterium]